jgi:hypothetical protein
MPSKFHTVALFANEIAKFYMRSCSNSYDKYSLIGLCCCHSLLFSMHKEVMVHVNSMAKFHMTGYQHEIRKHIPYCGSSDSSVGIATGYGLDG